MASPETYPLNARFAPVVAEALEVLAGEHGLSVETLARYAEIEVAALGCRVRFYGPDRVEQAQVLIIAADGVYAAKFHALCDNWNARPRAWRYPGKRLEIVVKAGANTPEAIAAIEARRRESREFFKRRDAEEGVA